MIRLENMLPKAFLLGIVEMVNIVGPEKTLEWLEDIARRLGDIEGGGIEGAREDDINYIPISPCTTDLVEFMDMFGEPEEFKKIIEYSNHKRDISERGWEYPALTNILGVLHHWYSYRRAEISGIKLLNVGSKSPFTDEYVYNEKAMEKAGMTREEVDRYLEKGYYVYKMENIDN
ncbi:conserved hypothetical protein [Methanosalsum zhilinae DSM 4017]|uniref:Uncharacterized protein n=1 Tax=Methanosalsum zhilinae (strain DSM 4017 / NBRC 107636 / OCM 62 / WeN5) TaxID=679901 RepID=F7XNF7_METZD|nr:hypothetical protein [Methanosalsum zhilinae]AEH61208.1 conserved hypothetical protein [Methanosalsum zhilinae DSM 4017]